MSRREPVERAIAHHDVVAVGSRLEALFFEGEWEGSRRAPEFFARAVGDAPYCVEDRLLIRVGFLDGAREHLPGEGVLSLGHRHLELAVGTAVELRRPACARARAAGEPARFGREQAVVDEALEVERRRAAGEPRSLRERVAAERLGAARDEPVKPSPGGVREREESCEGVVVVALVASP